MAASDINGHIAVIGGGINGIALAWRFAENGCSVTLYERAGLASATSSASSKLLHGGLRYLEQASFRLVREALIERRWWIDHAPHLARPVAICLPVYGKSRRSRWRIKCGLWLYDRLAGALNLLPHRWAGKEEIRRLLPDMDADGLTGGYLFHDGQMDDYRLALWAAEQARSCGATLRENVPVQRIDREGHVWLRDSGVHTFDLVINAAGPWAEDLLRASDIDSAYGLDLVRGSHLLLPGRPAMGLLLQHPADNRVFFVLPYQGQTLVGTTEVPQHLDDPITCSTQERDYLLVGYNAYFSRQKAGADVIATYAGLRPLVRSSAPPNRASRDYVIEKTGKLVTIWGGKWTTARAMAGKVLDIYRGSQHGIH